MEHDLKGWLAETPKYTVFRINKLKKLTHEDIRNAFDEHRSDLKTDQLPVYYHLKPDCLIVQRWPEMMALRRTGREVIVDAACAAAVMRGAHVFGVGVVGLTPDIEVGELVDIYGDIEKQCLKGLKVPFQGVKMFVGTGKLLMGRQELFHCPKAPRGIAIQTILPASRLPVMNESQFPPGTVLLQNLPSLVVGWVLNPKPNELILDMCASPGNKTTHLAELSRNKAKIIALDKTENKLIKLKERCLNHGVTCVDCYAFDSTESFYAYADHSLEPPYREGTFDKILLDGPCSGLGQRPQLATKVYPKMTNTHPHLQRKLLKNAVRLLKVGGKLVYSTCTIEKYENEEMVQWALDKFPCLQLVASEPYFGGPGWAECGLTDQQRSLVQRFGPQEDPLRPTTEMCRDTIGFFIASFTKVDLGYPS